MRNALNISTLKSVYRGVSGHYDFQHGLITAYSDQKGRELVVQKTVQPGDRILDAGGGTGSTALLAAQKAGPDGHVTVYDLSDDMLDVARQKAAKLGLSDRMDFQCGDLSEIPFAAETFDVVLSTYSLCPLIDPAKAALNMVRVLKKGGLFGAAHSAEAQGTVVHWLAENVENLAWKMHWLSMGCRAVSVLPQLKEAGYECIFETRIGVPVWPFEVFVIRK